MPVEHKGQSSVSYSVSGRSMILDVSCQSLWHGIIDLIGEALYLKQSGESFSIIPVTIDMHNRSLGVKAPAPFMFELLSYLTEYNHPVMHIDLRNSYYFEEVVFIDTSNNDFLSKLFPKIRKLHDRIHSCNERLNTFFPLVYPFMQKIGKEWLADSTHQAEKIFLKFSEDKLRKMVEFNDDRQIKIDEYRAIESFFKDAGYRLYLPEENSFKSQVQTIGSAEEVVALVGSVSAHALYMQPGSRMTLINLNQDYNFPHHQLLHQCNPKNRSLTGTVEDILDFFRNDIIE